MYALTTLAYICDGSSASIFAKSDADVAGGPFVLRASNFLALHTSVSELPLRAAEQGGVAIRHAPVALALLFSAFKCAPSQPSPTVTRLSKLCVLCISYRERRAGPLVKSTGRVATRYEEL
jgi:hypothetical protein